MLRDFLGLLAAACAGAVLMWGAASLIDVPPQGPVLPTPIPAPGVTRVAHP